MSSQSGIDIPKNWYSVGVLATGDLLALVVFVILGRIVHDGSGPIDWLANAPRIAAPFLLGWVVAAPVFGAYARASAASTGRFLLNSALTLIAADLIAFAVRGFLLSDSLTVPFVLTAIAFTALLVLGWRLVFASILAPRTARKATSRWAVRR